jgi:ATP-dependent DNA helicase RecG
LTCGKVIAHGIKYFAKRQKSIFELILDDGTARLHCRWWNLPFMEKYFRSGDQVVVYGKPLALKPRTIDHPETEVIETGAEDFIHLSRSRRLSADRVAQRWLRAPCGELAGV